jgi:hypothetical protein
MRQFCEESLERLVPVVGQALLKRKSSVLQLRNRFLSAVGWVVSKKRFGFQG